MGGGKRASHKLLSSLLESIFVGTNTFTNKQGFFSLFPKDKSRKSEEKVLISTDTK